MTVTSPQQNITQTLTMNQAQILTLFSAPFVIAPAVSNFINIFQKASVSYRFGTTAFATVNNALSFKLVAGSTSVVSNALNGSNILGLSQSTSITFLPANPYAPVMDSSDNAALVFAIDTANPTLGDSTSTLSITFTYSIFQKT
jgi:hypothetical protein